MKNGYKIIAEHARVRGGKIIKTSEDEPHDIDFIIETPTGEKRIIDVKCKAAMQLGEVGIDTSAYLTYKRVSEELKVKCDIYIVDEAWECIYKFEDITGINEPRIRRMKVYKKRRLFYKVKIVKGSNNCDVEIYDVITQYTRHKFISLSKFYKTPFGSSLRIGRDMVYFDLHTGIYITDITEEEGKKLRKLSHVNYYYTTALPSSYLKNYNGKFLHKDYDEHIVKINLDLERKGKCIKVRRRKNTKN